jgi:hypothetical protein
VSMPCRPAPFARVGYRNIQRKYSVLADKYVRQPVQSGGDGRKTQKEKGARPMRAFFGLVRESRLLSAWRAEWPGISGTRFWRPPKAFTRS